MAQAQRVNVGWWLGLVLLPLLLVAGASWLLAIEVKVMTQDPAAQARLHPLAGFLSSLGVLLWWTSASIWLFCAGLRLPGSTAAVTTLHQRFCLSSAGLSAYLALDDLFQIHESLAPLYLGIPERGVYGVLGVAVLAYLVGFRALLMNRCGLLLMLSLGLLAASVVVDSVLEPWLWRLGHWTYLVEDGLKWMGIAAWCAFCVVWCRRLLQGVGAGTIAALSPAAPP
jgi:hypothetical protein